jgi:uncharacterized protein
MSIPPPRVLVSGASGLVGRALVQSLLQRSAPAASRVHTRGSRGASASSGSDSSESGSHSRGKGKRRTASSAAAEGPLVAVLVRGRPSSTSRADETGVAEISWDPARGEADIDALRDFNPERVVHLSGANINGRWTEAYKREIWNSRVDSARFLGEALQEAGVTPEAVVCAGGMSVYDDGFKNKAQRGPDAIEFSEGDAPDAPSGECWLQELSFEWERAAQESFPGSRVASMRLSVVLHPDDGMLKQVLPPFRLGVGGNIGDGEHWFSWVALPDCVRAIEFLLRSDTALSGGVNVCSPHPVQNKEFTKALGKAVGRPAFCTVPQFALRLVGSAIAGGIVDEALLSSIRMKPAALEDAGFEFDFPRLPDALAELLD